MPLSRPQTYMFMFICNKYAVGIAANSFKYYKNNFLINMKSER